MPPHTCISKKVRIPENLKLISEDNESTLYCVQYTCNSEVESSEQSLWCQIIDLVITMLTWPYSDFGQWQTLSLD